MKFVDGTYGNIHKDYWKKLPRTSLVYGEKFPRTSLIPPDKSTVRKQWENPPDYSENSPHQPPIKVSHYI